MNRLQYETSPYASVALYALGGAVRDIAPQETAFFYRDADFIIGIETVWERPEAKPENLTWLSPRFEVLKSMTCGSYINFPYLGTEDYRNEYNGFGTWNVQICFGRIAHIENQTSEGTGELVQREDIPVLLQEPPYLCLFPAPTGAEFFQSQYSAVPDELHSRRHI